MSQVRRDFLSLSIAEGVQLAEDIWDSVVAEDFAVAKLTAVQEHEVNTRLKAHDDCATRSIHWIEVRAELLVSA